MNKNRLHILFTCILGILLLTGCATTPPLKGEVINRTLLETTAQSGQPIDTVKSYLYGGKGIDSGMSITCVQDGSCLLFGETYGSFDWTIDYLAVKISPEQKIVWAKTYDGSGVDRGFKVVGTSDGGYLLVGLSKSMLFTPLKSSDKPLYPLIIKTDSSGNIQWARVLEYLNWSDLYIHSAIQSSDNGYVISGYREDKDKKDGNLLFKMSENGDLIWANYYRPSSGLEVHKYRVIETTDQQLSVLFNTKNKFGLFMIDSQGKPLWAKMFKGEDTIRIWPESIANDQEGGFVITASNLFNDKGSGQAAAAILKLTHEGNIVWNYQYASNYITYPFVIMKGYDNDYLVLGVTGKGALGFLLRGQINHTVRGFALLLDQDGKEKSSILSEVGTGLRSVSKTHDKYFLFGDTIVSKDKFKWLLSLWQPQQEASLDLGKTIFSRSPFKLKEEEISIESKSVKLEIKEIGDILKVRELKIHNNPKNGKITIK